MKEHLDTVHKIARLLKKGKTMTSEEQLTRETKTVEELLEDWKTDLEARIYKISDMLPEMSEQLNTALVNEKLSARSALANVNSLIKACDRANIALPDKASPTDPHVIPFRSSLDVLQETFPEVTTRTDLLEKEVTELRSSSEAWETRYRELLDRIQVPVLKDVMETHSRALSGVRLLEMAAKNIPKHIQKLIINDMAAQRSITEALGLTQGPETRDATLPQILERIEELHLSSEDEIISSLQCKLSLSRCPTESVESSWTRIYDELESLIRTHTKGDSKTATEDTAEGVCDVCKEQVPTYLDAANQELRSIRDALGLAHSADIDVVLDRIRALPTVSGLRDAQQRLEEIRSKLGLTNIPYTFDDTLEAIGRLQTSAVRAESSYSKLNAIYNLLQDF